MSVSKKVIPVLASLLLCFSSFSLPVYAETIEQDGLSVSYTTDKEQYGSSDKINATLTVKNNNAGSVYKVELDETIPEGYKLADGSLKYKSISELKSGESQELKTVFVKNEDNNSDTSTDSNSDNSNNSSSNNDSSNNSNSSNDSKSADSSSNNSSQSGETNGNNNNTNGKTDNNPFTGDNAPTLALIALILATCVTVASFKYGKEKKMFSIVLVGTMCSTLISGFDLNAKAVGQTIKVATNIAVDGKEVALIATVQYENESSNSSETSVAEEYYKENAEIVYVVDVTSETCLSEAEVTTLLADKGFKDYPITYNYSLSGDFDNDQESDPSSNVKHPMYGTYYVSKNNEIWYVTVVGKEIYANPLSFNIQTERKVPTMLSTSDLMIGYDDEKDKLYTVIPKDSAMILVKVDDINAEVLDGLTIEEVDKL